VPTQSVFVLRPWSFVLLYAACRLATVTTPADRPGIPTGRLWRFFLDAPPPSVAPRGPAFLHPIAEADVAVLAQAMRAPADAVHDRLRSGRRAHAAWVAGNLAAYCWASFADEPIGEQGLTLRLRPGEAYLWDCATLPAYRRQGLYTALLAYSLAALRDMGLRSVWIGADLDNIASHVGIERAGFVPVADLYHGHGPAAGQRWVTGLPGAPADWVADARWALLGQRQSCDKGQ
jgi:ribosomal protein S18 acetylase RimI-like enzyme